MCIQACKDGLFASTLETQGNLSHTLHRSSSVSSILFGRDERPVSLLAEATLPLEDAVVQRWRSLVPGTHLPLVHGGTCQLLFSGRPGGSSGPDIHDAVLLFAEGEQRVGDVEFHVRSCDWLAHGHESDINYNRVMLHVVLLYDAHCPILRQDGYQVPTCSLYDIPTRVEPIHDASEHAWPCHSVIRQLGEVQQRKLLHQAGLLRFEQKTCVFVEALHQTEHTLASSTGSYTYDGDVCLIPALAEGLAYGRDRAFFRAAGQRLIGQKGVVPEPLGHTDFPSPLDAKRLHVLRALLERELHVWEGLLHIFTDETSDRHLQVMRDYFCSAGLSLARTDILLCNVVLPFAAAIALVEHMPWLEELARTLYETHPGLSSNAITRMMCAQLHLSREPHGSCQQQGLHYIYQQTCQTKRCAACMMGRNIL